MKNGIFKFVSILGCLVLFTSCATFFDFGEEPASGEMDRGFASNSEETDSDCTGRFCDKPAKEEVAQPLSYHERRVQRAIEAHATYSRYDSPTGIGVLGGANCKRSGWIRIWWS